jgi:hypothetical protein
MDGAVTQITAFGFLSLLAFSRGKILKYHFFPLRLVLFIVRYILGACFISVILP